MIKEAEVVSRILFISEALCRPFDEGIKNVAFSIHNQLKRKKNAVSVTKSGNNTDKIDVLEVDLNKLFFNRRLKNIIKDYSPDVILYLPEASVTFNSFLRAKVLRLMNKKCKLIMLGVKHINYSYFQKRVISKILKPDLLLLLGSFEMDFYLNAGMKVKLLPPAVDGDRFCKAKDDEKERIRSKYNIQNNVKVVLHVGHIRATRNVECFFELQKIANVQVVIAGSTSTVVEENIKQRLIRAGILVIDDFISDISSLYKMSDIYVFPVLNKIACIDMPLSVLEAMACNLPVVTTRFGGLTEYFKEDEGFRYFDTTDELTDLIRSIRDVDREAIRNREKVKSFSWGRFTDEIINASEGLV